MTGLSAINRLTTFASGPAARLRTIGERVFRVLTFSLADDAISSKKSLCVSIDKDGFSTAFGSRLFSRVRLEGFRRFQAGHGRYPQPEDIAFHLASVAGDPGALKRGVILSIPKAWAIIRTADVPATFKENLRDAISYEIDRLTPFKPEDATYDFRVLREDGEKLKILLAAVRNDLIQPYISSLTEKGFNVDCVTVNLSATGSLCNYMDPDSDSIFIELNENTYEGAFYSRGSIANVFGGDFTAGDEKAKTDTIMKDVHTLTESAGKQGRTLKLIAFLRDDNPVIKELLKLRAGLPVVFLNEADIKLVHGRPPDFSYAAAGGLLEALLPGAKRLNLLKKGHYEKEKTPLKMTIVLVLAVILMWFSYMAAPLWIENARLAELDRQIMLRKDEVRKVEALRNEAGIISGEITTIDSFRENRIMDLNIIKDLTAILPKTAWLTRIRSTETTVEIEGYAGTPTELLPKLEASKYFRKVEFASHTFRDARMNAERFVIKMELEGVKKEEPAQEGTGGAKNAKK